MFYVEFKRKKKNWKLNKKNCRKWPRLYRVIKKRHDVYDDFERKEEKSVISSQKKNCFVHKLEKNKFS